MVRRHMQPSPSAPPWTPQGSNPTSCHPKAGRTWGRFLAAPSLSLLVCKTGNKSQHFPDRHHLCQAVLTAQVDVTDSGADLCPPSQPNSSWDPGSWWEAQQLPFVVWLEEGRGPTHTSAAHSAPFAATALECADRQLGDVFAPAVPGRPGQLLPSREGHHTSARGCQGGPDPAG